MRIATEDLTWESLGRIDLAEKKLKSEIAKSIETKKVERISISHYAQISLKGHTKSQLLLALSRQ